MTMMHICMALLTAMTVLPSQGMRALRKGSLSMKTLGWMKSTVLMLSQTTRASVVLRISLSCSLLKEEGGMSFSYQ